MPPALHESYLIQQSPEPCEFGRKRQTAHWGLKSFAEENFLSFFLFIYLFVCLFVYLFIGSIRVWTLRALRLLGRHSTTWATLSALFTLFFQ
jgi:hypothetical protein